MNPIRLLIVDDHAIVRQGLRAIIRVTPVMQLAGEAENGREAVEIAAALQSDIVLMDLVMPELDGVAAIMASKQNQPAVRIIALTTFAEAELVLGAVQASADGYLVKDVDVQELTRAIRMVREGKVRSVDGVDVALRADTICLHGDGAHAVEFAKHLRDAFSAEGIEVRSLSS